MNFLIIGVIQIMTFPFNGTFANTRVPVLVRSHVILTVEMG